MINDDLCDDKVDQEVNGYVNVLSDIPNDYCFDEKDGNA